jgi:hypothetical protein
MILIKNIEWLKVNDDVFELISYKHDYDLISIKDSSNGNNLVQCKLIHELVRGIPLCTPSGKKIIIGIPDESAKILELSYEAFANLHKDNNRLRKQNEILNKSYHEALKRLNESNSKLSKIKKAGILLRLKWLLKGIDIY